MRSGLCRLASIVFVTCMAVTPLVQARSSDRSQPAKADGGKFSGDIGPDTVSHLDGNVVITQGTLKITGAHADLYTNHDNELSRAVITGDLAHVEQLDDANIRMTADAKTIDYSVDTGRAVLTGTAQAEKQTGGSVAGDVIHYDTNAGTFEAVSNGSSLVHVVFSSKAKSDK